MRWPAVLGGWCARLRWLALAVLVHLQAPTLAQAPADFDHLRTGFPLTGAHVAARCESCHAGGVFKGTPRDCESCHTAGARLARGNVVKSAQHIATTQTCETCHGTRSFVGARMQHAGIARGGCLGCHNGPQAPGKSSDHVRTTASCDSCHAASAWRPVVTFDHTGVAPGSCATCHDGARASGRGNSHVPYTQVAALAGAACDTCHRAGFRSWLPARLHASVSVTAQCATCHAGARPPTPVHTGQTVCESCHTGTSSWTGARVNHAGFTPATDCTGCHNGSGATGKSATHVPVGALNCIACHGTTTWRPSTWNHTQLAVGGRCGTCHTGSYPPADGRSAGHTPYQLVGAIAGSACDVCHRAGYTAWTPARLHASVTTSTQCSVCHAAAKPGNAIHAGQSVCENCHKSTSTWSGAKVDHAGLGAATDCASCHNGSGATGKPTAHVPVGATNCFTCHGTSTWKPSKWNHTQLPVTNQCATCHTGSYPPADGKPSTHTPYPLVASTASANCDLCHRSGYAVWTGARVHAYTTITAQCATCHAGIKPATAVHVGQTVCETCHKSTTSWNTAKVDHTSFTAATDCTRCHNGSGATGKPAAHVPVGNTNCFTCHGTSTWKPSKWNHTQLPVTNQCATCHTGSYPPADGKPSTHTPYPLVASTASANCDVCHRSGYAMWTGARVHAYTTITAQCATCHAGIKPATAVHVGQTVCETCHTSTTSWATAKVDHATFTAATDCTRCHNGTAASGKSATHIPVGATNCFTCHGTTSWKPSKWNHTQLPVTNQCATCHTGGYPPADGKSATHTPYQLVAATASANCDVCHRAGYTAWAGAKVHAYTTITAQCATCHAGTKPADTVHLGQTVCETCHKSTVSWSGARVDHAGFTAATNCGGCHNGTSATGKPAAHIPAGTTNCFTCHGTTSWKPSKWNHTQLPVTNQCATCHTGTYPPADGKPSSHTPYQLVAATASANCDVCHRAGYTVWTGARVHAYTTITAQCATCHAGVKPADTVHVGQTVCETCHKSTTTWTGARIDHAGFTAATNCAGCHNGTAATGKGATHVPVGTTNCYTCHGTTTWKPSKWNHTQLPVTNQCATCHTGTYPPADGKPANHIPYQLVTSTASANCDACHKGGYSSWANGRLHLNIGVTGQCKTCHNGSYTAWGALAKPANHIPEAQLLNGASMECNACHLGTASWSGARMNHNGSLGGGAGWCKACHLSGTSYAGSMERHTMTHRTKNPPAIDCSESGCHRPLGGKGSTYTKWD